MSNPALPTLVKRFVKAVNQDDTKAFLAFFPKDGIVIDSGRRFAGHDAILVGANKSSSVHTDT